MEGMGANIFGSVEGWCLEEGGRGTNHVCLYPDPLTLADIIND